MNRALLSLSDNEFVRWCYRTLIARDPEPAELATNLAALASGTTRIDMVQAFVESADFKRRRLWQFVPPGHFYSPIPSEDDIAGSGAGIRAPGRFLVST